MTVLMTADAVGGVWSYALTLARALAPRGVRVVLATMGPAPSARQRRAAAQLANVTLVSRPYRLEWMDDPWDDVARAGAWLLALEAAEQPDVVHLNGYAHGALPWRAPAVVVAHSCVRSWWRSVHGVEAPPEWDRYRRTVRAGLAGAAAVVAPSRAMRDQVVAQYAPPRPVQVIPNGCDPASFAPGTKSEMVLAVGRLWDEAKNIAALLDVAPLLDWPVVVAGAAAPPGGAARPLPGVHALGALEPEALAGWMARAAIYALPARYEPFGLGVLEAALSGCALVLGDIPSLRENWEGAALFVPPDDRAALCRALQTLTADASARRALAVRARSRGRALSPARMADAYARVYDAVRGAQRPPHEVTACAS